MRGKHCNVEIAGKLRQITPCWKSIVAHIVRCVNKDRSPRVRGKPLLVVLNRVDRRITPARAGKTSPARWRARWRRDHPRACGENLAVMVLAVRSVGSPPRVRGKREEGIATFVGKRITPARAGKTRQHRGSADRRPDHPRACGENVQRLHDQEVEKGSPPRVRGKPRPRRARRCTLSITPARAGKTGISVSPRCQPWDHPRACGENLAIRKPDGEPCGSPPRVRGKRLPRTAGAMNGRITPARAGKTAPSR